MAGLIVADWVEKVGGAERVLEEVLKVFPNANVYSLWSDKGPSELGLSEKQLKESHLSKSFLRSHKALALPFMPDAFRDIENENYEWIFTSSHLFAHHASVKNTELKKYSYVHSPARYIWEPGIDRRGEIVARSVLGSYFKSLDKKRSVESHLIAANSNFVRERIQRCWGRDSNVIYPPVDVLYFNQYAADSEFTKKLPESYVLGVSRFIPYKNLELVIDYAQVVGLPVVLAGAGPEEAKLRNYARQKQVKASFFINPHKQELRLLYQNAATLVFPPCEDFGIVPVEAMAAGTPVVALNRGGSSETVIDGQSGFTIPEFSVKYIREAHEVCRTVTSAGCVARAANFSAERFSNSIRGWVL